MAQKGSKAGKKKQRLIQPNSRRDMIVLAGLPQAAHMRTTAYLKERFPLLIVLGYPGPPKEGALYPSRTVSSLMNMVGDFAVARRTKGPVQPLAPATITLLYVPSIDDEKLLRAFDFAVMPVPLASLLALDARYRPSRHDPDAAIAAVLAAIDKAGDARTALNHVVRRLAYQSSNEGMLLPPHNYLRDDGDLSAVFREFRQGKRAWTDRMGELGPDALTSQDMPKRIPPDKTDRMFVDARGMAFPIAHPTAYDGPPREIEPDEAENAVASTLRSLYRFGGPVARGLHHDAQRSDGSALQGATFHCSEQSTFNAQGNYANIYPNDYVRIR